MNTALFISITNMRRMSYATRWALFIILIITLALIAFKILESLPIRKAVAPRVYPNLKNYKLNSRLKEVSHIRHVITKENTKSTTVAVTKQPKIVIRKLTKKWNKKGNIFYREIMPLKMPKMEILLLHGRKYTSKNWVSLKTMNILAAHGYRVIAMDLPGPGSGRSTYKFNYSKDKNRVKVLATFISKVGLVSPVIVSPSESGLYSLPYIAALPKLVSGFVSIAASGTDRIFGKDFKHFPPTLILRGSKDTSLGVISANVLKLNVLHSTVKVIENAGHACYIDKPEEFHQILLKFLHSIVKQKTRN